MATNTLKTRIKHKNGTPDEWSQATNFSPLKGELIVYNDATNPRMKIGDGETNVNDLPFINNAFVTIDLDGANDGEDFVPDDNLVINAETLGGKPASSYMLKTDTATNSNKLDGKPPSYYLPAVQLLDNPDFAIAQAGYGGLHGNTRYAADRWPVNSGSITPAKTNNGFSLTSGGTSANIIWQFLRGAAGDYLARPFTLGVYTQDGNAYAEHFIFPSVINTNFSSDVISIGNWKFDVVFFTTRDMPAVRVYTTAANDTIELRGIALLPGTYTAENIPPYIPKGYAAELAECQRYYYKFTAETGIYGYIGSAGNIAYAFINLPQCMRTQAVSIEDNTSIVIALNGGTYNINSFTSNIARGNQLELKITFTDTKPSRIPIGGWVARGAVSADL